MPGGRFDPSRHLLLSRETGLRRVGVDVVTPFRLNDGNAFVLVDRGWIGRQRGTAHPEGFTRVDSTCVVALARRLHGGHPVPAVGAVGATCCSAGASLHPDPDTLAARWFDVANDVWLVALPGVRPTCQRFPPEKPDLNAPVVRGSQWAIFTIAALGGAAVVVAPERKRASVTSKPPVRCRRRRSPTPGRVRRIAAKSSCAVRNFRAWPMRRASR